MLKIFVIIIVFIIKVPSSYDLLIIEICNEYSNCGMCCCVHTLKNCFYLSICYLFMNQYEWNPQSWEFLVVREPEFDLQYFVLLLDPLMQSVPLQINILSNLLHLARASLSIILCNSFFLASSWALPINPFTSKCTVAVLLLVADSGKRASICWIL